MMPSMSATTAKQRGFTLAEVAVVVLIVGLLLGGLLGTYSTQIDLSRTAETKKTLETARDALIGFAAANGRLPCPATVNPPHATTSNGVEAPPGGGACAHPNRQPRLSDRLLGEPHSLRRHKLRYSPGRVHHPGSDPCGIARRTHHDAFA